MSMESNATFLDTSPQAHCPAIKEDDGSDSVSEEAPTAELEAMGFSQTAARRALAARGGDPEAAAEMLLSHGGA